MVLLQWLIVGPSSTSTSVSMAKISLGRHLRSSETDKENCKFTILKNVLIAQRGWPQGQGYSKTVILDTGM